MTSELKVKHFINKGLELVTCDPDDKILTVKTKMLLNDFSQIPVTDDKNQVVGCVSWKSIGKAESINCESEFVKDYLDVPLTIYENDNFLNHLKKIAEKEYVIVVNEDREIKGILTTYDMTMYFYDFINPYLRIGIIENCIRKMITDAKIQTKKDINDLDFYNYQKILKKDENWKKLKLKSIDKETFISKIDEMRRLRNNIAHYKPKPINKSQQFLINSFANILEGVSK
jgi:hypothetical protein